MSVFPDECKDCHDQKKSPATATVQPSMEAAMAEGILKERPAEEVAARIAQQNQEERDIAAGRLAIPKHIYQGDHADRADLFLHLISVPTS